MSRTMLAYRFVEWEQPPRVVQVDVPKPGSGEVLVKVAGNGLCHSDIGMRYIPKANAEAQGWHMPFTLGHEVGGWIEELGPGVGGWAVGEPVALISANSCGACRFCLRGQDNACPHGRAGRGYGRDGGLAPYVLVGSTRQLIRLRHLEPVTAGPLTDAGATSYHAVKRALPKLIPGSTAVVIGVGGLGSFAVQFLRALSPARVIAIDSNPARLAFARELGAHETLAGVGPSTVAEVLRLTTGEGAEAVLDFVGIDDTITAGLAATRKAGAFALVGAGGGTVNQPLWFFLPKDADIFTFQGGTIADTHEVIALVEAGLVRNEVDLFPFSRVEEAYRQLDAGALRGRAVVIPES